MKYSTIASIVILTAILLCMIRGYILLFGINGRFSKATKVKIPQYVRFLKFFLPFFVIYLIFTIIQEFLSLWST